MTTLDGAIARLSFVEARTTGVEAIITMARLRTATEPVAEAKAGAEASKIDELLDAVREEKRIDRTA